MNPTVEVKLERTRPDGQKEILTTIFRSCRSKLELAPLRALVGELIQTHSSYNALKGRWAKAMNGDADQNPAEAVKAFAASGDLESAVQKRAIKIFNELLGALLERADSGTSPNDYEMEELGMAALQYLNAHLLTEPERKN